MKLTANDLVVRYDPETERVSFLVPKSDEDLGRLKRFYEFSDISKSKKARLAKEFGIALVAFFEATHRSEFVTADAVERSQRPSGTRRSRKAQATSLYDARLLIDRIDDSSSTQDVESITEALKSASAAGDKEAKRYLKTTWPRLREVLIRRISRRK